MNLIIRVLTLSFAVLLGAYIIPGVEVNGITSALLVGIVLIALNTFLKPLLKAITLPINIVTLGLFSFILNAIIILIADMLLGGFEVANFGWAIVFSLVLSLLSALIPGEQY